MLRPLASTAARSKKNKRQLRRRPGDVTRCVLITYINRFFELRRDSGIRGPIDLLSRLVLTTSASRAAPNTAKMKLQLLLHATSVLALQAPRGPLRGPQRQHQHKTSDATRSGGRSTSEGPPGVPALAAVAGAVLAPLTLYRQGYSFSVGYGSAVGVMALAAMRAVHHDAARDAHGGRDALLRLSTGPAFAGAAAHGAGHRRAHQGL